MGRRHHHQPTHACTSITHFLTSTLPCNGRHTAETRLRFAVVFWLMSSSFFSSFPLPLRRHMDTSDAASTDSHFQTALYRCSKREEREKERKSTLQSSCPAALAERVASVPVPNKTTSVNLHVVRYWSALLSKHPFLRTLSSRAFSGWMQSQFHI